MRAKTPNVVWDADIIWAASAAAYRINGNRYVKYVDLPADQSTMTNNSIAHSFLRDPAGLTEQDRIKGQEIRRYYSSLTFKILSDSFVSGYDRLAMTIAQNETIQGAYHEAVILSLPASYEKAMRKDAAERKINFASGGYLGKEGDKIECSGEVVKSLFSQKWGVFFISIVTDSDQAVFFSFKTDLSVGTKVGIKGTIKSLKSSPVITQLNRVRVLSRSQQV